MNMPVIDLKVGVKGRFIFQTSKDGVTWKEVANFDNLVTNTGLDDIIIGTTSPIGAYCAVGSGNTPPANNNTSMQTFVARKDRDSTSTTGGGSPNYTIILNSVYQFPQGAAAGNLTEVGIGFANGAVITTETRALIVDGGGSPTTITVLADEFLTVTHQLIVYPPLTDATFVFAPYTLTVRTANAGIVPAAVGSPGWYPGLVGTILSQPFIFQLSTASIGAITTSPGGTTLNSTTQAQSTYTNGTFFRDFTFTWSPAAGAFTANSIILRPYGFNFQVGISPTLNKTASQLVTLVFRVTVARV